MGVFTFDITFFRIGINVTGRILFYKKEEASKRQNIKGIETFRPKDYYRTEFWRALQKTIKNEFIC
jgi:hypothetical protein